MAYTRVNWEDLPSTNTPRNATNLNKMDLGIFNLDNNKADITYVNDYTDGTKPMGSIIVDDVKCKNLGDLKNFTQTSGQSSTYLTIGSVYLEAGTYTLSWTQSASMTSNSKNTPGYFIGTTNVFQTQSTNANMEAGRSSWTFTITTAGTYGFRWWINNPSTTVNMTDFQLEVGNQATIYTPYKKLIKEQNGYVKENTTFYANDFKCKNMLNTNLVVLGGYSDSGWASSSNYLTVQYIPVSPNTQYTLSSLSLDLSKYTALRIISFNANKTFIRRSSAIVLQNVTTITTDNDAYYIALSFYTEQTANVSDLKQGQFELGSTATTYTPHKEFENKEIYLTDIYSTNETTTNKVWIDGKPIYRKVCVLNVAGHSSTWTTFSFATLGLNNIDYIYMADGTRNLDSGIQIRDINYNRNVYIATNTSTLEVGPYSNATVLTIVFEYTKTTDTGNRNIIPILDGKSSK